MTTNARIKSWLAKFRGGESLNGGPTTSRASKVPLKAIAKIHPIRQITANRFALPSITTNCGPDATWAAVAVSSFWDAGNADEVWLTLIA